MSRLFNFISWLTQFMMDFELKLEKPNISRAWISAATMGAAYFIGKLYYSIACCVHSDISRRLDTHDTLLCHDERHPRTLRINWYHGGNTAGLRFH